MLRKSLTPFISEFYSKENIALRLRDDSFSKLIREGEIVFKLIKNFPMDDFHCVFDSYQAIADKLNKQKALLVLQQKTFNATLMATPDGAIATDLTATCTQLISTTDHLIQLKNEYELGLKQIVALRNQMDSIYDRGDKFFVNVDHMISAGYITDAGPSSTGILSKDEIVQLESSKQNLASIHINMNVYHIIDVGKLSKEEAIKLEESHLFDIHAYEKASETIIKEIEACIMNAQKDISLYEHKKALYETIQKEKENKSDR